MTYKIGSPKSAMVAQIQRALHLYPDGIYGKLTEAVVRQWQSENGLKPDGIVGPATLAKLLPLRIKKSQRKITDIIVHCTATRSWQDIGADDIRRMHKAQGWSDIGYHYVVRIDGTIEQGRDVDIIGAHVEGHNAHSIGICYVGGLDNQGKAKDTRTENQKCALLNLLMDLRKIYPNAKISGHRDFPNVRKECPCFNAQTEYRNI